MATSIRYTLNMADGTQKTLTINNADPEVSTTSIRQFANGLPTNSALFNVAVSSVDQNVVVRTTTDREVVLS